jgi:hypothetical protein
VDADAAFRKYGSIAESMGRIGDLWGKFAGESAGVELLHPRGKTKTKPL